MRWSALVKHKVIKYAISLSHKNHSRHALEPAVFTTDGCSPGRYNWRELGAKAAPDSPQQRSVNRADIVTISIIPTIKAGFG